MIQPRIDKNIKLTYAVYLEVNKVEKNYQSRYDALITRLQDIENLPERNLNKLSRDIDREIRGDFGYVPKDIKMEFFTSKLIKNAIIDFSEKYCVNNYILENLIRIMGISSQYGDYDDVYYQFIFDNINNTDKKIKITVSYFIWRFPQFKNYENNWEYLVFIQKLHPKVQYLQLVLMMTKENPWNILGYMPENCKNTIIELLQKYIDKNRKNYPQNIIELYEGAKNKLIESMDSQKMT